MWASRSDHSFRRTRPPAARCAGYPERREDKRPRIAACHLDTFARYWARTALRWALGYTFRPNPGWPRRQKRSRPRQRPSDNAPRQILGRPNPRDGPGLRIAWPSVPRRPGIRDGPLPRSGRWSTRRCAGRRDLGPFPPYTAVPGAGPVGVPRIRAGCGIQQGGAVAHAAGHRMFHHHAAAHIAEIRAQGVAGPGRLQAEQPAARGRNADRAATVIGAPWPKCPPPPPPPTHRTSCPACGWCPRGCEWGRAKPAPSSATGRIRAYWSCPR